MSECIDTHDASSHETIQHPPPRRIDEGESTATTASRPTNRSSFPRTTAVPTDGGDSEHVDVSQRQCLRKDDVDLLDEMPITVSVDSCAAAEEEKSELPSRRRSGDETTTRTASRLNNDSNAFDQENTEDAILSPLESLMHQNVNSTVRWTMTGAALLFVLAGFLTILVASQYRFFLACVWATLLFMFVAFVWFVQQTVICSNSRSKRIFHPAVHAVADWVQRQMQDFRDDVRDCYNGILLLSNEPEFDSYKEASVFEREPGDDNNRNNARRTARKPKSALFRVVVKPALSLLLRGRRRRRQKRAQQEVTPSASLYVPPSSDGTTNRKETELV